MPEATFTFPSGFMWGTATSSHQVEGNNTNNNWYAWEQDGHVLEGHHQGLACDWWGGRWKEDFDRAVEGGQNAHRLSLEWSRIQPAQDRWNEDALDHYREILRGLHERDVTPMVTLHHFTDPLWVSELGGWENPQIVPLFAAYTAKVIDALKEYVTWWCTINEPNVVTSIGYVVGDFPPGKQDINAAMTVMANQVRAHAAAYHAIHDAQPEAQVGIVVNYRSLVPRSRNNPLDRLVTTIQKKLYNDYFPVAIRDGQMNFITKRIHAPEVKGTQEFLGINYYSREQIFFDLSQSKTLFTNRRFRPGAQVSPTGFIANEPLGFFESFKWGNQFGVPLVVTEHGIEDAADELRPRVIVEHIHQLWRAVNHGYPIKGYFHWSLVDNFEWERGWSQPFGLWELDIETQARMKRPSADLFAAICKQNALSSAMIRQYAPEVVPHILPG